MMSDQGKKLEELMNNFLRAVSYLKTLTNMASLDFSGCATRIPSKTKELVSEVASLVIPEISEDYYATLGKHWFICANVRFRCWETTRLVAEACRELVSPIVAHTDVQAEPLLLEYWINIKRTLEGASNSIASTLAKLEANLNVYVDYKEDKIDLHPGDVLMASSYEDYITQAEATEKLMAEVVVQARNAGNAYKKTLESKTHEFKTK
jgi:hypothetical protein